MQPERHTERTIWAAVKPGDIVILASGARYVALTRYLPGLGHIVLKSLADGIVSNLAVGAAAPIIREIPPREVNSATAAVQLMLEFPGSEIITE